MNQKSNKIPLLRNLNSVQKKAVEQIDGPNLILAGAGSGKTRVLTHKIAYLIDRKKVRPENILAMTFTNKAANEMKLRVAELLKDQVKGLWIGTFHSNFAKILRKNSDKLGYTGNFVIYDESDQLSLIKTIIKELELPDTVKPNPRAIRSKIKYVKNSNLSLSDLKQYNDTYNDEIFERIFLLYQTRIRENNAMDFEDLLLKSIELFRLFPSVLEFYQNIFHYILVDEYQDTNKLQYELIKMLAQKHKNISVVGDDDQSIYGWRGAEIRNILNFEKDFANCKIYRLEQNYRSTGNILKIAHSIIIHNINRMDKELWTKKDPGEKITLRITGNTTDEANFIVETIIDEMQRNQRNFSDFAILYRVNSQSRAIEESLKNNGISYVVVGGIRFYERKEIKDVLAYLKILVNQNDSVSIKRIINYPSRGIGEATINKIDIYCREKKISFYQALGEIEQITTLSKDKKAILKKFHNLLKKYIGLKGSIPISELINCLIDDLGIIRLLKQEDTIESLNRIENIRELITGIDEFLKKNPNLSLEHYLENVSLITDLDNWDTSANAVSLLTLHSAKGLEFPVVFITGLEEGLFPLVRQMSTEDNMEEERRLFYVGATRAQEKLYLSAAKFRRKYGENTNGALSRFINELDRQLIILEDYSNTYQATSSFQRKFQPKKVIRFAEDNHQQSTDGLKTGILVKHPRFGVGVVKRIEGNGDDRKVTIIFRDVGEKKIVVKYSNLEIVK